MRICVVGDFSDDLDEGFKNISHYLAGELDKQHTVVRLNAKRIRTAPFWRTFVRARPDVIHTISQPTDQSLILTGMLRGYWPRARTVMSALRPEGYFVGGKVTPKQNWLIRTMRPDLVLVQNDDAEALFRKLGCHVSQLPNGVDLDRFRPADQECKQALRRKYALDEGRPVVLHVGHLREERNLMALQGLLAQNMQVVVVGSLYMGPHHDLIVRLERAGFQLLKGYQPNVEELYMLSDCYVFPVPPGSSITMPLSVLEAMACNLPVITQRFEGLVQAFVPGNGLQFFDGADDLPGRVETALQQCRGLRHTQHGPEILVAGGGGASANPLSRIDGSMKLVCVTGIDGTGKTTLAHNAAAALREEGKPAVRIYGRTYPVLFAGGDGAGPHHAIARPQHGARLPRLHCP